MKKYLKRLLELLINNLVPKYLQDYSIDFYDNTLIDFYNVKLADKKPS